MREAGDANYEPARERGELTYLWKQDHHHPTHNVSNIDLYHFKLLLQMTFLLRLW